jgi:hypothetical protein
LLTTILAASESLGVRAELENQWNREGSGLTEKARMRASRVTAKAWRFAGEMGEISATFSKAGVPDGFHQAAGDLYGRISHFKGAPELPSVEEVLAAIIKEEDQV